jgi:hypothetical protein
VQHHHYVQLVHRLTPEARSRQHATVYVAVLLLRTLPPEVARHGFVLHFLRGPGVLVVINGADAGVKELIGREPSNQES